MSGFKPTEEQSAAINARGSAVLVSAGAGSGKTKVLTERLMSYITDAEDPVDLDSFLIITFTRAAAGELRGRITEELALKCAADPSNRRLRRQNALCRRTQIGTIHSFCSALLRENSHLAGISPDFKVADEERAQGMKSAALERVLEARYAESADFPGFLELADTVGVGRDDSRLAELVLSLHEKMQCHARPELWAREQVALLSENTDDAGKTPWGREILSAARDNALYWSGEMDALLADMAQSEKISAAYSESIAASADAIRALTRALDIGWDSARECLPIAFPRLGSLRNSPDTALSERIKLRRDACKKAMAAIEASLASPSGKLLGDMAGASAPMSALLSLTLDFDKAFSEAKRRAGLVDYSDLEHIAARLLTNGDGSPTELARRLSARYTEVMVDEYQDVNRVQDAVFKAVSDGGRKLFLVGDVKQSIYRFRLADPALFTEKYNSYKDYREAAPGEARRILLRENFRSRKEIINCVNAVFSNCMSSKLGEIDYDEAAALRCGANFEDSGAVPELLLLSLPAAEDGDEDRPDKLALEARLVGNEIRRLMADGTTVNGRRLEYGDIALIMRSANTVGGVYARTLTEMGIPVSSCRSGDFFDSVEVSSLRSMLAVIDNPHQDIPLIAVLRSPAVGFSADKLSHIRSFSPEGDFYTALERAAENDEECRAFLETLRRFRESAPDEPVAELLWRLVDEFDMLAVCSALPDGDRRRANIFAFLELSERFDATLYRGLHRFVLWLRRLAESGKAPDGNAQFSSAVQIMTVHKSKGLEFPVVFLCDTARRFNRQDSRDTVLVHPRLGLGPKVTDLERRVSYPTLARSAVRLALEREMLSEEMRLLYVALTRAKERLFITAAVKEPEKLIEKSAVSVTSPMAAEVLSAVSAPVNWLVYAALADGEKNLKIRLCTADGKAPETETEVSSAQADPAALEKLRKNLSFKYPHAEAVALPSKITATELKSAENIDADAASLLPAPIRAFTLPDFARKDKPLTGAERGTATHLALQYMDFAKTGSLDDVKGEIERLSNAQFLSPRQAEAVDARAIYALFASPLGARMLAADRLHREFKFSLLVDAGEICGAAKGEQLLLQGVVDCCIEEGDRLCIIDYKTDNVKKAADLKERAKFYAPQLRAYAAALRRIFGREVSSCVLYFLSAQKAVEILQKDLQE